MLISRAIHIENVAFATNPLAKLSFGDQRKKRKFGQRIPGDSPYLVGLPTSIPRRCHCFNLKTIKLCFPDTSIPRLRSYPC